MGNSQEQSDLCVPCTAEACSKGNEGYWASGRTLAPPFASVVPLPPLEAWLAIRKGVVDSDISDPAGMYTVGRG